MKCFPNCVVVAFSIFAFILPARAANYTITDLGTGTVSGINASGQVLGFSASQSENFVYNSSTSSFTYISGFGARAINNLGQLCGNIGSDVVFYDGTIHDLGVPLGGSHPCKAYHLNDSGEITGQVTNSSGVIHGFFYNPLNLSNNGYTDINTLSGISTDTSYGFSVNASGTVEGDSNATAAHSLDNPVRDTHAFLWNNGAYTDLGTFGGPDSSGIHVNNANHATGTAQETGSGTTAATWISHIFFWNGTTLHDCGILPGDSYGNAGGMNNFDVIVGYCLPNATSADNLSRAVIYNGAMTDLNTLIPAGSGFTLTDATDINDSGRIVADAYDTNGIEHAVLLTPVPEPASVGVLAIATLALCSQRRRLACAC